MSRSALRGLAFGALLVAALLNPAGAQPVPAGIDATLRVEPRHTIQAAGRPALTRLDLREFDVSGPGEAVERFHWAATIFRADGRDRGVFTVPYDGLRRIRSLEGRIRDADGRVVRRLGKSDVRDVSAIAGGTLYDESRIRIAELYHDRFPYTVEFELELRHDGLINWPAWYPQSGGDALEFGSFSVRVPAGMPLRHAALRMEAGPVLTEERGRTAAVWTVALLPAFKAEDFGPPALEQQPSVRTAPAGFEIEKQRGDMSSWASFADWYRQLSLGADVLPAEARLDLDRLLAGAPDDRERVHRIYSYMQGRTRYVSVQLGLGGWKPFDAAYVHVRGYGDCKALTNYTIALLRAAGIEAYPALIRHGVGVEDILDTFPSNQFNHVVAFVPLPADTVWLETTSQTMPFGHLGAGNEDRFALVVRDGGGELLRTPRSAPADNRQVRSGRIVLEADGTARADVVTTYSGIHQDRLRSRLVRATAKERGDWLHDTIDLPQFEVLTAGFDDVASPSPAITLPVALRLPGYATKGGSRLFFTPVLMDRWNAVPAATEARTQDVDPFAFAFETLDSLEYVLPVGFVVEALPEPITVTSDFGRFEMRTERDADGPLRVTRRVVVEKQRRPASSFADFREFLNQIARADRAQVVLVRAAG